MDDAAVGAFLELLRFPSISTDPAHRAEVGACAGWVAARFRAMGLEVELCRTPGHPLVLARNAHRPDRRTVLIYGHYDVQPADPLELWEHPPFEPRIRDGIVTARGATDNKGQFFAHMLGVEATLRAKGDLPVNLIFLVEGEEEVGSQSLGPFLEANRERLACDVIAISDTGMVARGHPTFSYGLRGLTAVEVCVKGPATDLHSGIYGGAVANPATVLARLLASLHDGGNRVAVEGFYDGVRPVEAWEREAWAGLPAGDEELLRVTGAPQLDGEVGRTTLERIWARPTAEINGMGSGYQGPGGKTVLPAQAFAKLTFRLVPDQDPANVQDRVIAHLRDRCPPSVRIEIERGHSGAPYLVDPRAGFGAAACRALRRTFGGKEPALVREGGSVPIVADFKRILGAESLLLGLALPDCRIHAPNENFPLENLEYGMRLNRALLEEIAAA